MRQSLRWGVWVSLCAGAAGAWAAPDGALYQCPRNLFTNQIDEAQAKAQACTRVLPGRLTQAALPAVPTVQPVVPADAVSPESASAAASAPPVAAPAALPTAAAAPPQPLRLAASAAPPLAPATAPVPFLPAAVQRISSAQQRGRDQDAQSILRAELTRTQAAQLASQRTGAGAPSAVQTAALSRLREDEAALLRELARFRP